MASICTKLTLDAAGESLNLYFVGGYLRAFREKHPDRWEDLLDTFTSSEKLKGLIPELTRRSGFLSERSAQRILRLLIEQSIEPGQLMHFAYGQATNQVNETTVIEWIEALLDRKSNQASSVALTIYANYYLDKSRQSNPPADLTFRLVTSPGLVEITDPPYRDQMVGYYWNLICQTFVNQQPYYAINLGIRIKQLSGVYLHLLHVV